MTLSIFAICPSVFWAFQIWFNSINISWEERMSGTGLVARDSVARVTALVLQKLTSSEWGCGDRGDSSRHWVPMSIMIQDLQGQVEAQRRSSQLQLHIVSLPKTLRWLPLRYGTESTPPRRPPSFQDDLAPLLPSHLHIFTLFSLSSHTGFFEFFKHSQPFAASVPLHKLSSFCLCTSLLNSSTHSSLLIL